MTKLISTSSAKGKARMTGNLWIILGVLAAAFAAGAAAFAVPYGFHLKSELKSEESTAKIIAEIRKTTSEKVAPDQLAVFKQVENVFVFQTAKPKNDPGTTSIKAKREAKVIFSVPGFEIQTSYNITSIIDSGLGDVSIVFGEDFPDKNYYVDITGNKTITVKQVIKGKGSVRIKFEEQDVELLQVVCTAA